MKLNEEELYQRISKEILNNYDEITKNFIAYFKEASVYYSNVLKFIYSIEDEKKVVFVENFNNIQAIISKYDNSNTRNAINKILKIHDYVLLEIARLEFLNNAQRNKYREDIFKPLNELLSTQVMPQIKEVKIISENSVAKFEEYQLKFLESKDEFYNQTELVNRYKKDFRKTKKKFEEQKNTITNLHSNFISILGIFASIIIAFFGGLNVLGSILNNIEKVSKYRLTFITTITGFIIFNIIFMLLYSVAKLTDKNISSSTWSSCSQNSNWFKKFINPKYPFLYYFNLTCILIAISTIIGYGFDFYNIPSKFIRKPKILKPNIENKVLSNSSPAAISTTFQSISLKDKEKATK